MSRRTAEMSDRDHVMIDFVARNGVASARQIERLAFPTTEHGSDLTAARRSRRALQRLTNDGLLTRLDRRVGGVRAGSSGFLYQLGTQGRRTLGLSGRGRHWEPSQRFIDHCLAAGDVHVGLIEAQRDGRIVKVSITHEPKTWRRFAGPHGALETIKPDLLVELDLPSGWQLRWFVEVDRGTEHLPTVIAKCLAYQRYWRSGAEAAHHHEVFPRVLWSVPDSARVSRIERAISGTKALHQDLFRVATATETTAALLAVNQQHQQKGGEP